MAHAEATWSNPPFATGFSELTPACQPDWALQREPETSLEPVSDAVVPAARAPSSPQ